MIQHSNDYETPVRPIVEEEPTSLPLTVSVQGESGPETEGL